MSKNPNEVYPGFNLKMQILHMLALAVMILRERPLQPGGWDLDQIGADGIKSRTLNVAYNHRVAPNFKFIQRQTNSLNTPSFWSFRDL